MSSVDKRYGTPGSAPGTLAAHPDRRVDRVLVTLMDFDSDFLEERPIESFGELARYRQRESVTWIDVVGLHDLHPLLRLGEIFELHPLALEDVLHTGQRPKIQEFENGLFLILQLPTLAEELRTEQISLFIGIGWIITLRELPGPVFDPVRRRLRQGGTKIRQRGADYLAYALMDAVVDLYFPLLETLGDSMDVLQDELVADPARELLATVQQLKSDLLELRHAVWSQRELFDRLVRRDFELVEEGTRVFFQDCYDHSVQLIDTVEYYREIAGGLIELYLTGISHRTNEVMKVLTIMASVFIPLNFIAGVYGMNFNPAVGAWSMPELNLPWGYPAVWLVMVSIAVGLFLFFRRKRWL